MPTDLDLPSLVELIGNGAWGIPEWQRTFEARPTFVANLADSLYRRMLIGGLTVWRPDDGTAVRSRYTPTVLPVPTGEQFQLLDGQQRATSIALIFGIRPGWLPEREWTALQRSHAVEVSLPRRDLPPLFADASRLHDRVRFVPRGHARRSHVAVPLDALMQPGANPAALAQHHADGDAAEALRLVLADVARRLTAARIAIDVLPGDHGLARENFLRLNTSGRKVSPAAIVEGFTAIRMPGFTTERLDPFMGMLADRGRGDIRRVDVLRTFHQTVGLAKHDHRTAPLTELHRGWERTEQTWAVLLDYLADRGVLTRGVLGDGARVRQPISPALLWTMYVYLARWPDEAAEDFLLHWAVATAVCAQRPSVAEYRAYEGAARTAGDVTAARARLIRLTGLEGWPDLSPDVLQARRNDFPALLAYLAAYPAGVPALTGAGSRPVAQTTIERALPSLPVTDLANLVLADSASAGALRSLGIGDDGRNQLRTAHSAADAQWIPRMPVAVDGASPAAFTAARTAALTDPRTGLGARLREVLPAPTEYLPAARASA